MVLTKIQKEAIIEEFLSEKSGLNSLLSMIFNSLMKIERDEFLRHSKNNKGNGYRFGFVHGYGR